jgi:transcriptional regulator NrdR family protein
MADGLRMRYVCCGKRSHVLDSKADADNNKYQVRFKCNECGKIWIINYDLDVAQGMVVRVCKFEMLPTNS